LNTASAVFTRADKHMNDGRMLVAPETDDVQIINQIMGLTLFPVDTINSDDTCTATVVAESSMTDGDNVKCVVVNGGMNIFVPSGASTVQEEAVKSRMRASIQEGMDDGSYVVVNESLRSVTLRPEVEFAASDGAGLSNKTSGADSSIWIGTIVGVVVLLMILVVLTVLGYRKRQRTVMEQFSAHDGTMEDVHTSQGLKKNSVVVVYDMDDNYLDHNELEVEYNVGDEP